MRLVQKLQTFKSFIREKPATRVILHHTAGGNLSGAVSTLKDKGFGYHYIIDKDATVYQYVDIKYGTSHAYANNRGTIGISFVGGGEYGPCTLAQLGVIVELLNDLKNQGVTEFSGHKHVDPRGWKIDPRWPGEPANKVDWKIDREYMEQIALATGLTPIYKQDI